jgi:hypothetical protein
VKNIFNYLIINLIFFNFFIIILIHRYILKQDYSNEFVIDLTLISIDLKKIPWET